MVLCVVHNFIRFHEPLEPALGNEHENEFQDPYLDTGTGAMVGEGRAAKGGSGQANERWDQIAEEMWIDYQHVCRERGIGQNDWLDEFSDDEYDSMISV